jgi:hypothetical protein
MLVGTLFVGFAHDCRFVGLIFVIIIIVGLSWRCRIASAIVHQASGR